MYLVLCEQAEKIGDGMTEYSYGITKRGTIRIDAS